MSYAAAQLAFSLLFSVFSFLFFLVTLAAFLPVEPALKALLRGMHNVLPLEVAEVLEGHLRQLIHQPRLHLLGLGLAGAVWSASRGVDAMRVTLNRAYHVTERRASEAALRRLADEQAALRRVATAVAAEREPEELFSLVIEEVGRLLEAQSSNMIRSASGCVSEPGFNRSTNQILPNADQDVSPRR